MSEPVDLEWFLNEAIERFSNTATSVLLVQKPSHIPSFSTNRLLPFILQTAKNRIGLNGEIIQPLCISVSDDPFGALLVAIWERANKPYITTHWSGTCLNSLQVDLACVVVGTKSHNEFLLEYTRNIKKIVESLYQIGKIDGLTLLISFSIPNGFFTPRTEAAIERFKNFMLFVNEILKSGINIKIIIETTIADSGRFFSCPEISMLFGHSSLERLEILLLENFE